MSDYNHELIGTIGVSTETYAGREMAVSVGVDTLGMCTVSFGTAFAIRINEADVDKLRDILYDASRKLTIDRIKRESRVGRRTWGGNGETREPGV